MHVKNPDSFKIKASKAAFLFLFKRTLSLCGFTSRHFFYLNKQQNSEWYPLFLGNEKFLNPVILFPKISHITETYVLRGYPITIYKQEYTEKYCIEIIEWTFDDRPNNDEILEKIFEDYPGASEFFLFNLELFR